MQKQDPQKAFILSAGHGKRLKPHTDDKPKPMVRVGGIPLISHILDKLSQRNITDVVINLFYLGDRIKDHLKQYDKANIHFSEEKELLDTGGGLKKALSYLNNEDFFLINGDSFWIDTPDFKALDQLASTWRPEKMDILLLLQDVDTMHLTEAVGDYDLDEEGRATRNLDKNGQYMFTGVRISKSTIFDNTPDGAFSYLQLMDEAEKNGKLYGLINQGEWHHISTPKDLDNVNTYLKKEKAA